MKTQLLSSATKATSKGISTATQVTSKGISTAIAFVLAISLALTLGCLVFFVS